MQILSKKKISCVQKIINSYTLLENVNFADRKSSEMFLAAVGEEHSPNVKTLLLCTHFAITPYPVLTFTVFFLSGFAYG